MANKIVKIGQQTTNLLSNDNLIVYRDISMKSKFNAAAASTTVCPYPQTEDYYSVLGSESYVALNNGTCEKADKQCAITIPVIENGETKYKLLKFHANDDLVKARMHYIGKMSQAKYRIEKNINVKAVQESLHNIFTWIPGERILNPEFGSNLYRYLYAGITDFNTEQIMAEIRKCISEWEPRVQLEQVKNISTVDDTENNTVHLEIIYTIPSLSNEQYSYTYVYHKQSY